MMTMMMMMMMMITRVDDISEKMYEFEVNKKNNLLFYGVGSDNRETPDSLIQKVMMMMIMMMMLIMVNNDDNDD